MCAGPSSRLFQAPANPSSKVEKCLGIVRSWIDAYKLGIRRICWLGSYTPKRLRACLMHLKSFRDNLTFGEVIVECAIHQEIYESPVIIGV